jgi:CrcB protein
MAASTLVVALGGALGAASRHLMSRAIHHIGPVTFPYGTLIVNITGCFLFGVVAGIAEERAVVDAEARRQSCAMITVQVCGQRIGCWRTL